MINAERIKIARTSNPKITDCYATALFLVGKIKEEKLLPYSEIEQLIDKCTVISKPEIGCLVSIWNGEEGHLAVVSCLEPFLVTDRFGIGGDLRENIPLFDVLLEYGGLDIPVQYLKP